MPDLHIVDRYMKTVESFDVKNDGKVLIILFRKR
jgi:hypothetical protein